MIHPDTLSADWIRTQNRTINARDPFVFERMLRAFSLLEGLAATTLPFIFKGGTSLLLALPVIRRFSVDIDLLIAPELKPKLPSLFDQLIAAGRFLHWEEDQRPPSRVPKQHFRFHYTSTILPANRAVILLDILYATNPYPALESKPIALPILKQHGEPLPVVIPTAEGLLADKLTACAANTIGVRYDNGKGDALQLVKQLFDVGALYQHLRTTSFDWAAVLHTFHTISAQQAAFREQTNLPTETICADISQTTTALFAPEAVTPELHSHLRNGVLALATHLNTPPPFHMGTAAAHVAPAIHLANLLANPAVSQYAAPAPALPVKALPKWARQLHRSQPEAIRYWHTAHSAPVS